MPPLQALATPLHPRPYSGCNAVSGTAFRLRSALALMLVRGQRGTIGRRHVRLSAGQTPNVVPAVQAQIELHCSPQGRFCASWRSCHAMSAQSAKTPSLVPLLDMGRSRQPPLLCMIECDSGVLAWRQRRILACRPVNTPACRHGPYSDAGGAVSSAMLNSMGIAAWSCLWCSAAVVMSIHMMMCRFKTTNCSCAVMSRVPAPRRGG